jgi:hypothetical protein
VFRKPLLPGHLTGNTTNTASLLLDLQGVAEGIIFSLTISVFTVLPQDPLSNIHGALAIVADII